MAMEETPDGSTTTTTTRPGKNLFQLNTDSDRLAPFSPTCHQAQRIALSLLSLTCSDVLFDLGCGDGRFLFTAANECQGLTCIGIEMNKGLVIRARTTLDTRQAQGDGLYQKIEIRHESVLNEWTSISTSSPTIQSNVNEQKPVDNTANFDRRNLDEMSFINTKKEGKVIHVKQNAKSLTEMTLLDDATAVFVYLLPKGLLKIKLLLEEAMRRRRRQRLHSSSTGESHPKFRVVSYMFQIAGWRPVIVNRQTKGECAVYLYDETSITLDRSE